MWKASRAGVDMNEFCFDYLWLGDKRVLFSEQTPRKTKESKPWLEVYLVFQKGTLGFCLLASTELLRAIFHVCTRVVRQLFFG